MNAAKLSFEQMLQPDPNGEQPKAGIFVGNQNTSLQPYKFSGATTAVDDSRRYMLMVGSVTGIPEHLLAEDPSTSNLATSKTLERPSELQFQDRQKLWADILHSICQYVIDQAALAPKGLIDGKEEEDEYGEIQVVLARELSRKVSVSFPDVVEHDVLEQIQAVIDAGTLKGQSLAGTIDLKTITRLLLRILKVDDADDLLQKLFPTDDLIMQRAGNSQEPARNDQNPGNSVNPGDPKSETNWKILDQQIASTLTEIQESLHESG